MIPGNYDLTIYQGQTFVHEIEITDSSLAGINLQGFEAKMQIRDSKDVSSALVATLHSDLSQILSNVGAVAGTFDLSFGIYTTNPIPWNASKTDIKGYLEALPNIGVNNIFTSGGPLPLAPINISFVGPFEHINQPLLVIDDTDLIGDPISVNRDVMGIAPINAQQSITTINSIGGTFTISYKGQTTAPIAWNATAGAVQSALQALTNIGAGNVTATGGQLPALPVIITFIGALAHSPQPLLTIDGSLLLGGPISSSTIRAGVTGQNARYSIADTLAIGGNFSVNFLSAQTAAMPYNATTSQFVSYMTALPAINNTGNISIVSGGPLPTTPIVYDLIGSLGQKVQPPMTAVSNGLTGGPAITSTTTAGVLPTNAVHSITGTGTGGTFTLTTQGQTTGAIAANATAAQVATALQALSNVGAGGVTTSGGPLGTAAILITYTGSLGHLPQTPAIVVAGGTVTSSIVTTGTAGISAVQSLTVTNATSGTFTLTFNGVKTQQLPYNANIATIQNALQSLAGIAQSGLAPVGSPLTPNVTVTDDGTHHTVNSGTFTITFGGTLAHQPLSLLVATDQNFREGSVVITQTNTGAFPVDAVQTLTMGPCIGGTFTLTFNGQTTVALPFNATASQIQSAFATLGILDIQVVGGPFPLLPITVNFINTLGHAPQSLIVPDNSHLIGGSLVPVTNIASGVVPISEKQRLVAGRVNNGTFTITFNGQTTAPIDWDATDLEIQTALRSLSGIGSTGINVVPLSDNSSNPTLLSSGLFPTNPMQIQFVNALANTSQPLLTIDSSLLLNETGVVIKPPNDGIILINPEESTITLKMFADKTSTFYNWSAQKYYDLKLIAPNGDVERLIQGKVTLDQQVTSDEPFTGITQPEW